jgi:hypothetical protein
MAHTQQDTDMWVWSTQTAFKQKPSASAPLSTCLFIPQQNNQEFLHAPVLASK